MAGSGRTGDALGTAVSEAMGRLYLDAFGKGPVDIATVVSTDLVVTVLRDVFTTGEKTLLSGGHEEIVRRTRLLAQHAADDGFRQAVASLSGRNVLACIGGVNVDRDMASEVFILASE